MYLESKNDDHIQFAADNTARMTILTSGEVGIGQNSPTAKLEVEVGTTDNVPGILIDNDDVTNDTEGLKIDMAEK